MKYSKARYLASYPSYKLAPKTGLPEIAFGGRSNVGKSSLLNSLLNQKKLAQISKTPGKTRLLNYFAVMNNKNVDKIYFVDLPGYGYARVSHETRDSWKALVEGYLENSQRLKGFLLLIDSRRGIQDDDIQLMEYLQSLGKKTCPILTKSDKLGRQQKTQILKKTMEILSGFAGDSLFPILHSAKTGEGNDLIWRWIGERIDDETE
ncbi:MAG: YihA family ribosome biogenesis GTP-binding protein [Candidatus Zixiibacteriota bacterium]|nr:MAG: YihA family ribosome biogenesis GTP-binding protein [candidate division Zixibacteria bacterium]